MWLRQQKRAPVGMLDRTLFHWATADHFTRRSLLEGVLILGSSGSAKTSSSGRQLMQAIVDDPKSGGLILLPKSGDIHDIRRVFEAAGRAGDLIHISEHGNQRLSFLDWVGKAGVGGVVNFLTAIEETTRRSGGSDVENGGFWQEQMRRKLYNDAAALMAAGEPVTAPNLQRFGMGAASSQEELRSDAWRQSYHAQVLEKGYNAGKTERQAHDFSLVQDFYMKEWPALDPKTRGNVQLHVTGLLHTYNSGLVREMASGISTFSPELMFAGKWIACDFPPPAYGAQGLLLNSGLKFICQQAILQREVKDADGYAVIWADEAHLFVNEPDAPFVAMSRSHLGCTAYISQSVSSFRAAMPGKAGEHKVDSLLANFATTIFHACDPVTAKWGVSKVGRQKQFLFSTSGGGEETSVYDELWGKRRPRFSFSEHFENTLQEQQFQHGLRRGGPINDFLADAIVIKAGEPFTGGSNHMFATFSQKGRRR